MVALHPNEKISVRRPKGEGSIYRRKDGLWVARYEAAGRRRYLYAKTKNVAVEKLRERLSAGVVHLSSGAGAMSVSEYLDRWLPKLNGAVAERTQVRYEVDVRVHINPAMGHIKLPRLSAIVL